MLHLNAQSNHLHVDLSPQPIIFPLAQEAANQIIIMFIYRQSKMAILHYMETQYFEQGEITAVLCAIHVLQLIYWRKRAE